ncbi:uncharacterized protein BKA55DRAFT_546416 [Fusarium redolens]|uniref:Uncharacterized protein n=1 Tax=Fusarium redolens TaxID=48865 RepID=A0A9P9FYR6_FUSRE|nr:uncharacterized protein BKA55DRAFT_546416 [Fusarium redolens]KAH7216990.1 hypothetical protein BKA55DRAFT_546416 [Fusarium redolens]
MSHLDCQGVFNLTLKPNPETNKGPWVIDAFSFQYKSPWDITFSSREIALKFSFPSLISSPGLLSRIPTPGLESDGKTHFRLDPNKTKQGLHSTVKQLFDFSEASSKPPTLVADWRTTLVVQSEPLDASAAGKRNGLWIRPSRPLQTSIRLQFSLDNADVNTFNKAMTPALTGFTFDNLDVICKKAVVLADTDDGNQPIAQGSVIFHTKCTNEPKETSKVPVIASVSFQQGSYNITVQLRTKDDSGGNLSWLMGLVPSLALKFIIRIGLSCDSKGQNTKLKSFSFDIEVEAKFCTTKTGAGNPAMADLKSAKKKASISDVIKGILGDDSLKLPGFLDNMAFCNEKNRAIHIEVKENVINEEPDKEADKKALEKQTSSARKNGSFQFIATLTLGDIKLALLNSTNLTGS